MDARLEKAQEFFHQGAYGECLKSLLPFADAPEAIHLRLMTALRRRDSDAAYMAAEDLSHCRKPDYAAVGSAYCISLRMDRDRDRASVDWPEAHSRWAKAEIAYARASVAFMRGAKTRVLEELAQVRPATSEQHVRYIQMRAWGEALTEDFLRQTHLLLNALTRGLEADVDRGLIAIIAHPLAVLAREVDLGELGERAAHLLSQVKWPEEHHPDAFYARRALAWCASLRGEWIDAMRQLDSALLTSPNALGRALIFADRARISKAGGEAMGEQSARANAFACFESMDWKQARRDESLGLFAAMDVLIGEPDRARRLFDAAVATQPSLLVGISHTERTRAFRLYAESYFAERPQAIALTEEAARIFRSVGYIHREMACVSRLLELHSDTRLTRRAERFIAKYPRSLAARMYERAQSPIGRIRGRRREVLNLLVEGGLTAREIGDRLGMKETTVRVHIKTINKTLNVQSRAQLVHLVLDQMHAA